jgi:hypothetical protein
MKHGDTETERHGNYVYSCFFIPGNGNELGN